MYKEQDVLLITDDEMSLQMVESMLCKGGYAKERLHSRTTWQEGLLVLQ